MRKTIPEKETPKDDRLSEIKKALTGSESYIGDPTAANVASRLTLIIDTLVAKASEILGASDSYHLVFTELETVDGEQLAGSVAWETSSSDKLSTNITDFITLGFQRLDLSVDSFVRVMHEVKSRIHQEYSVGIGLIWLTIDGVTCTRYLPRDLLDGIAERIEIIDYGVLRRCPGEVVRFMEELDLITTRYVEHKTWLDIAELHPAEQLYLVKRKKMTELAYPAHSTAYSQLQTKIEKEIEMLKERKSILDSTGYEESTEYDPLKRGLTRQLAMLLLDELFPNLTNASNKAKGEFLELMTGYNPTGLRNKWSDLSMGNPKSLAADRAIVAEWRKKLKIPN